MIWKCSQVKAAGYTVDSVPLTVVLCYKKISLGQMNMKRVQRQVTDWHKIFTVDMFDERLYIVKSVQKMQSRKKNNWMAEKHKERLFFRETQIKTTIWY